MSSKLGPGYQFPLVSSKYRDDYNFPYDDILGKDVPQFHKELFAYRLLSGPDGKMLRENYGISDSMNEFRFKSAFDHLVQAAQLAWSNKEVQFVSRGIVNDYLLRIMDAWCEWKRLGVAGSASTGKSFGIGVCVLLDWWAAPSSTLSMVASTSLNAIDDRIWADLCRLHRTSKYKIGEIIDYRRLIVFERHEKDDDQREYKNAIKCVALPKGQDGKKVAEEIRGRKNQRVRFVIDEMAEMDMFVMDPMSNLFAGNSDVKFAGIANPLNGRNPHYNFCLPKGENSYDPGHRLLNGWETNQGYCVFLCGERSPNMQVGEDDPPPFPTLMSHQSLKECLISNDNNKNSINYWRDAIGGWPPSDISMTVLSKAMVLESNTFKEPTWAPQEFTRIASLDPAFTYGGDRSVLTIGRIGRLIRGKQIAYIDSIGSLNPDASGDYIESLAKLVVKKLVEFNIEPINFGLDVSGDGGKVAQAIMREWAKVKDSALSIVLISSGGPATDRPISEVDRRKCSEVYDRLVTEYWFSVATAIKTRCLFGLDPEGDAANEFYSRKYTFKNRKQAVVTKDDMKTETGKSPDNADSAALFLEMCRRRGLMFVSDNEVPLHAPDDSRWRRFWGKSEKEPVSAGHYDDNGWGED